MSNLLFQNTSPEGHYEVSCWDEVSGEWELVGTAGPWDQLTDGLLVELDAYLADTGLDGCDWELRDADHGLRACGHFDGRDA